LQTPGQAPALSSEHRDAIDLLRSVLVDEGRDSARQLLRDIVERLEEPQCGNEAAHVAFLLELDGVAGELGSLEESRRLCERGLAVRSRLLPPDHSELLAAKQRLAAACYALRDLAGAKELFEAVLKARTRLFPPEHPEVLSAQSNLAATRYALGDLAGAKELFEAVLGTRLRTLPPDHPGLLGTKQNVAGMRYALGDLAGAKELFEEVLDARLRLLPPDSPALLATMLNLAATRAELGDLGGAKELEESVVDAWTRQLPPDHPDLLAAKANLAATRAELGDLAGAEALETSVLEVRTRQLPRDHPDLLRAKLNLAGTRKELGDIASARELEEAVLEAWTRLLPPDHPDLLIAKQNLASTLKDLGDLAGAKDLEQSVLDARSRSLPCDHHDLLDAKQNLAVTEKLLGDVAGAQELVSDLLKGVRARADALLAEAARPAREGALADLGRLSGALFVAASGRALEPDVFATLESLRLTSLSGAEVTHAIGSDPELARDAREVAKICGRLNDLAVGGPTEEDDAERWRAEMLALGEARDRAERGLRRKLAEAGAFVDEIDAARVGARLAPGAIAASFLRYTRWFEKDLETGETPSSVDSLLAFVVKPGGTVERVELGPAAEIENLAGDWRCALGKPIEARDARQKRELSEEGCGRTLRARVLDPLLASAGEDVRELHVVLDDVLFLVPLDALPLDDGTRVGERFRIHVEPTMARLLREDRPLAHGRLVALGGIDFDGDCSEGAASPGGESDASMPPTSALLASATPPLERSGRLTRFESLPQTRHEVDAVVERHRETLGDEILLLSGSNATKAALFAAAPKARWLHVATHGWFASEGFKSQLDARAEQSSREVLVRAERTLVGFAPETLCGLALAGANRGKDALGRVLGILSAEELACLDLRNCELAVLSACETNVGIRRAGQGIQSLQTALHGAGARAAITSLWRVDDAATRRLFELFYAKLWHDGLGKHGALWQAKMALRAERHRPRDWAGWVLSGDPD
jgi:CHAT domain-containing protein